MQKIKLANLKVGDIFSYKGIIYEIEKNNKWSFSCKYYNPHFDVNKRNFGWSLYEKYLYCDISKYITVEID